VNTYVSGEMGLDEAHEVLKDMKGLIAVQYDSSCLSLIDDGASNMMNKEKSLEGVK